MGQREYPANTNGPSSSARRERDPKDPVQHSSGNSQSGSDEQQPSSSNACVEVTFSARTLSERISCIQVGYKLISLVCLYIRKLQIKYYN